MGTISAPYPHNTTSRTCRNFYIRLTQQQQINCIRIVTILCALLLTTTALSIFPYFLLARTIIACELFILAIFACFKRYLEFEKERAIPIYIAFGIGGTPEKPKEAYVIRAPALPNTFIPQHILTNSQPLETLRAEM